MKLVSYQNNDQATYGAVVGDRVVELGRVYGQRAPDLKAFIAADLFADARARVSGALATLPLKGVQLLPVIPNPGKIFCIGLNYGDHIQETGKAATEKPVIFLRATISRTSPSVVCGPTVTGLTTIPLS